ncbi:N-acetylmuramoyl-L-alanine amidase [Paraferrimonas haliotis]|uniref:N-acetylmuramoyl-L-alanine amidase n=1 Tax=Paraferrimonas haliotis TaxID=2013866 RepID=A0AA37TRU4_9GAMM|nr:N-acetylmuramoyl-L-alanine amidase [Paraferrimonas haliotis]GLS83311.1 N-acetylmuramoyl-L-alanine amidase [Paraferrimonas haliotis]
MKQWTLIWIKLSLLASFIFAATPALANKVENIRFSGKDGNTRVVFDLSSKPSYNVFSLKSPDRLVIDLASTRSEVSVNKLQSPGRLIKKVRNSKPPKSSDHRFVLDLSQKASFKHFTLAPVPPYGYRLVVDLAVDQPIKQTVATTAPAAQRDVVVAVDAGHGGRDPGSIGPAGTKEKALTLEISKRLAKKINATSGMRAVLIRSNDSYVDLTERSERARRAKADILLSIHADAFRTPQPRGAGVFVLSDNRYTRETNKLLRSEDKYTELVGAGEAIKNAEGGEDVAQWLVELNSVRSLEQARTAGQQIYKEMDRVTRMHRPKVEYKSLAVLKATDIPSLLIETGFLSNPQEEKMLKTRSHQEKLVTAIHKGLLSHFYNNPPEQTLFAQRGATVRYKVRSGDSLSAIAQVHGVKVSEIKKINKLSSSNIRIGQTLMIPRR